MRSISAGADMNSSAASRRFHKCRIKPRAVSNRANGKFWRRGFAHAGRRAAGATSSPRYRAIECAGQTAQRGIGHGLVPVVESGIERFFAIIRRKHRAQDGGHPQQQSEAALKADAAKSRESHDCDHSQSEANDHFRRLRRLCQIANATCYKREHGFNFQSEALTAGDLRYFSCGILSCKISSAVFFLARLGPDVSSKR